MPKTDNQTDMLYFVASDSNQGKQSAYVIEIPGTVNVAEVFKEFPYLQTAMLFTDREQAYQNVEKINAIYRENGTYGHKDPESGVWQVYDNDRNVMLHGEEAESKVVNDVLRTAHGTPETIDPTQLDLSDSNIIQQGYWGPNYSVHWQITDDGTLTLNGKHITNEGHTPPWAAYDVKKCVINCDSIDECVFVGGRIPAKEIEIHCKDIGSGAFSHSPSLEKLSVHADNIADSAFSGCENLKSANIECNGQMEPFAFFNCPALEIVNVTGDIDTLQDCTFANCANLKTVTIEGNTDISNHALPDGTRVTRSNEDVQRGTERKTESVRRAPRTHEQETKKKETHGIER